MDDAGWLSRSVVAAALASVLLVACGGDPRPNIVLVTLDTTRPDFLGCYGGPEDASPNLDRFARRATLYERAWATSSWTLASHASLFTGLLPRQHGAQSVPQGPDQSLGYGVRPLADSFTTLAEALQGVGYRTGAVVAGPALRRELGVAQGFEVYRDELDSPARRLHGKRARDVADEAIELVERFGDGLFFLFVNFFDPHAPYRPPPPHDAGLPPDSGGEGLGPLFEKLEAGAGPRPVSALGEPERSLLAEARRGYRAEIRYMDEHLGRLLAALPEDSLVVVTGDHGESFGEHYLIRHGVHLYEDNVRVPLVVREPGQTRGRRLTEPVQNHWVASRLLAAAGAALPVDVPPLRGGSAPIVLQVQRSEFNVSFFGSFFDRDLVALVDPPFKLIESSTGRVELYDLEADPGELEDLSVDAPEARRLREGLAAASAALPPLYDPGSRAQLGEGTAEALRALGYLD
jgi:arylsulfatase A-like enzyme